LRYYGAFLTVYLPTIPFLFAASRFMSTHIPRWPLYNVDILLLQPGEVAAHLVGAMVFALIGFRKLRVIGVLSVAATLPMIVVQSRGAMLAAVIPVVFAALVFGKVRQLATVFVAGVAIFAAAYIVETSVTKDHQEARSTTERALSTRQIAENAVSIVGQGSPQTEGTKVWRLRWWTKIVDDTVFGPHFWTGRGFGLNLANADGFSEGNLHGRAPLRDPHNVVMTVLARAGVPGEALWLAVIASWMGMLMHAMWVARRRGQREWAGLFLFVVCYVMSILFNAAFDVALSGPMQGIWFWCLMGFGIGSVMVYRCQPPGASR
jgi:O-antigen ligase